MINDFVVLINGWQVVCQVEALVNGTGLRAVNPSVSSAALSTGMRVTPAELSMDEDGAVEEVTIVGAAPFVCGAQVAAHDCHLSLQLEQVAPVEGDSSGAPLAFSSCMFRMNLSASCGYSNKAVAVADSGEDSGRLSGESALACGDPHKLRLRAVADFSRDSLAPASVRLRVSSYGDTWWHGFRLPELSVRVRGAEPLQCHALTLGHIIGVDGVVRDVEGTGRYLLYRSSARNFQVWVEYGSGCSGGASSEAACICSVQVYSGEESFYVERCADNESGAAAGAAAGKQEQRHLPKMALHGAPADSGKRLEILESRKGKMITAVVRDGARVRIRLESWGMSVSVVSGGGGDPGVDGLCGAGHDKDYNQYEELKSEKPEPWAGDWCRCSAQMDPSWTRNAGCSTLS